MNSEIHELNEHKMNEWVNFEMNKNKRIKWTYNKFNINGWMNPEMNPEMNSEMNEWNEHKMNKWCDD